MREEEHHPDSSALRQPMKLPVSKAVAVIYLLFGIAWIFLSDLIARQVAQNKDQLHFLSNLKGWLFIFVTALLLYGLLRALERRIRREQQQLKESKLRLTIAAQAGGIGVWDRDIVNHRLIWDDRMCELYGIRNEEFGGTFDSWLHYVHPDDREQAANEAAATERGEKEFDAEFRILRPDGEIRYIRAFGKSIRNADGTAQRMIGTNQDITQRKQAEEDLRQRNTELERFNKAAVGRELRMIELKREINALCRELGRAEPYSAQSAAGNTNTKNQ